MSVYNAPGVFVEDKVGGSQSITQLSSAVGVMIGETRNGILNQPQKIGSWSEFISKYAVGLDTPFMENSFLPYSVHGFFNNGGKELYVISIKNNAKKATSTGETSGIVVTASTEGEWGNKVAVTIKKGDDDTTSVTLKVNDDVFAVVNEVTVENIESQVMANSKFKQIIGEFKLPSTEGFSLPTNETIKLKDGSNGVSLTDTDYINALSAIEVLDDVTMVAIPGQSSSVVVNGLISFCDNHELFPIIDSQMGAEASSVKNTRKSISAFTGAFVYPWGKMNDPLTNSLKLVPPSGHVMGVYARIIANRGIHKAPAGVDAVVRGFVEMEAILTPTEISTLNPVGVICIVSRPNAGIVIWGARSLNSKDSTMRYVTDGLLNLNIKKSLYEGTQFAVFEPNDATLWSRVQASCKAFLETLRLQGALKGSADEAYYVVVDDTNNTDDSIAQGQLNIEVGYSPVKPAEFVVIQLSHSIDAQ